jgi:lysyl-tRNA synthetase class 2
MGKICFIHIQDEWGKIQAVLKEDEVTKEQYKFFVKSFDLGDFIGVEGEMIETKTGEISVLVKSFQFLGKAILPPPEKFHGLKNEELLYRQRYLDLMANPETMERFKFRSNLIKAVREFYWSKGFLEVETPTLLHSATGANAKPYVTHNNALDIDVYLRISHELPLKELIVGGFEKIFELGKAFRNEGTDPSHLPEHTHIEHYCAYWNFEDNMKFTEDMFDYLFTKLNLPMKLPIIDRDGKDQEVDFTTPWPRIDFVELIKKDSGIDIMKYDDADKLIKDIKKQKIDFDGMDQMSLGTLVDNLFKKVSRPKLLGPCFVYNYPKYVQPLARTNDQDEKMVDQFQLVINGWEILKAYSELVDPIDQAERFSEQASAKAKGDEDAMATDDEYITAMMHGMPPISGWGLGLDRLVTLLTHQTNLRDVVFFPLMRSEGEEKK